MHQGLSQLKVAKKNIALVNQTELLFRVFMELPGLTEAVVAENECDALSVCYCFKRYFNAQVETSLLPCN